MSFQETCDFIFKLYLYADNAKMIHYTIDSMHGHELADDVRDTIIEFADDLAEQYFGYYGKPRFGQLSVKQEIKTTEDINKLCQQCIDIAEVIRSECDNNTKLSGIVSLVDSFKENMSKLVFLGTFDKVSSTKLNK